MVINFYGEGCFKIQTGDKVILTDPFDKSAGLTPPRIKPDIEIKTIAPFPFPEGDEGADGTKMIFGAGEYDVSGISVDGFQIAKESAEKFLKTAYMVEAEGIRLCFLGHISEIPEPSVLEHLEEIDILFLPAGGAPFLEQKAAAKLARQLEPKIIIPSFYKETGLKRKADDLKVFLSEFGAAKEGVFKEQEKLSVKKKDIAEAKGMEVVALKI
jgi:L-ascorbate metabolism protein UlaG (beta-lactamase superfamily)